MTAQPKRPIAVETEREAPTADMARRIVERVNPLQVILFGSMARGEQRRGSDVDLLVIIPDDQDRDKVWRSTQPEVLERRPGDHTGSDQPLPKPGWDGLPPSAASGQGAV